MSDTAPDTTRFRATVEYDGAGFHGYQVQPELRTVQGVLEERLARLFENGVRVIGAGRTDRGVHAAGLEIAFDAPGSWNLSRLEPALAAVLPADIGLRRLRAAASDFHPRFQATGRRYEYFIGEAGPLRAARVWQPPSPPDPARLAEAAALLPGRRSFEALSRAGQPELGSVCTIEQAAWSRSALGDLRFVIVADRFLHRMVRYIVATLVDVARGRRTLAEWDELLEHGTGRPPEPAPAAALYLTGVRYPEGWNRPAGVPGLWPIESADRPVAAGATRPEIEIK
ncbi:MAG: tRNA pseudouridine(38-40) synthase TruA [Gemmatimonadales bacterium]|jgi:tRNA pseudouridine38-40 synthase